MSTLFPYTQEDEEEFDGGANNNNNGTSNVKKHINNESTSGSLGTVRNSDHSVVRNSKASSSSREDFPEQHNGNDVQVANKMITKHHRHSDNSINDYSAATVVSHTLSTEKIVDNSEILPSKIDSSSITFDFGSHTTLSPIMNTSLFSHDITRDDHDAANAILNLNHIREGGNMFTSDSSSSDQRSHSKISAYASSDRSVSSSMIKKRRVKVKGFESSSEDEY